LVQIPYAVTHRIEEAFVALLREDPALSGIDIVAASNRDATVYPLHVFVLCKSAVPQPAPYYLAEVVIAVVTNIDDQDHAERRRWAESVISLLTSIETYDHVVQEGDPEPYLSLEGWFIRPLAEASADQQTGDLIPLTAGIWCVSGQTDDRPATTV